jgi:hypothetical protein
MVGHARFLDRLLKEPMAITLCKRSSVRRNASVDQSTTIDDTMVQWTAP